MNEQRGDYDAGMPRIGINVWKDGRQSTGPDSWRAGTRRRLSAVLLPPHLYPTMRFAATTLWLRTWLLARPSTNTLSVNRSLNQVAFLSLSDLDGGQIPIEPDLLGPRWWPLSLAVASCQAATWVGTRSTLDRSITRRAVS